MLICRCGGGCTPNSRNLVSTNQETPWEKHSEVCPTPMGAFLCCGPPWCHTMVCRIRWRACVCVCSGLNERRKSDGQNVRANRRMRQDKAGRPGKGRPDALRTGYATTLWRIISIAGSRIELLHEERVEAPQCLGVGGISLESLFSCSDALDHRLDDACLSGCVLLSFV